jgi:hypothetical protein
MAQDTVDLKSLAFWQCYGRDLVRWEIIDFFAAHPDERYSLQQIAEVSAHPSHLTANTLADMARTRLLEEEILVTGPVYCLTQSPQLRRAAVGLGAEWEGKPRIDN